ncbi:MAG TPA: ATPase P [Bacteroidetes bacterium]|nr:ATPase P [Bacteroidota bacterium]
MIEISIPGKQEIWQLKYLVLDLNGTLALDGQLLPGVEERIRALSTLLDVYVLTADTFGTAVTQFRTLPCHLHLLTPEDQVRQKENFVNALGSQYCVAIGNGLNDKGMLQAARLGICITGPEGAATETLAVSDIVIPSVTGAFDLLFHTKRIKATLRK